MKFLEYMVAKSP